MKNTLIYCIFLAMIFCSCFKGNHKTIELTIDNPSDTEIKIRLDSEEIVVAPKSLKVKIINSGSHNLQVRELDTTIVLLEKVKYLLNPALATYFKEEVVYLSSERNYREDLDLSNIDLKFHPLNLLQIEDTIPIYGPYKEITNKLLISTFDYNVNKDIPMSLKSQDHENVHKIKIYRYFDFLKKLSKTNEILHKRFQLSKLEVEKSETVRSNVDFFKERKQLLSQVLPKAKKTSTRMSVMEINEAGEYSTIIMYGDSTAIFLSSNGYLIKSKLELNDQIDKKEKQQLISALSFFNNVSAIIKSEKNAKKVEEFNLPEQGEVYFHTWQEDHKYSKRIAHSELIKNNMKTANSGPFDMLYSQGYKIIDLLNKENQN